MRRVLAGALCYMLALLYRRKMRRPFLGVLIASDTVLSRKPWRFIVQQRFLIWVAYAGSLLLYLQWRYCIIGSIFDSGSILISRRRIMPWLA